MSDKEESLLKSWAESFPDPRCEPEIAMEVILPAHIAACCVGLYAMRVAYLGPADNVWVPLLNCLREVNQPVIRTRNSFSSPPLHLLACI